MVSAHLNYQKQAGWLIQQAAIFSSAVKGELKVLTLTDLTNVADGVSHVCQRTCEPYKVKKLAILTCHNEDCERYYAARLGHGEGGGGKHQLPMAGSVLILLASS